MKHKDSWIWFVPFTLLQGGATWVLIQVSGLQHQDGLGTPISTLPLILLLIGNRMIQSGATLMLKRYALYSQIQTESQFLNALSGYSPGKLEDPAWQNKIHHLASRVPSMRSEALRSALAASGHLMSLILLCRVLPALTFQLFGSLAIFFLFEQMGARSISRARLTFQRSHAESQRKIGWLRDLFYDPDSAGEIRAASRIKGLLHRFQVLQYRETDQFLHHDRQVFVQRFLFRSMGLVITTIVLYIGLGNEVTIMKNSMGLWVLLIRCGQALFAFSSAGSIWWEIYPVWREFIHFCKNSPKDEKGPANLLTMPHADRLSVTHVCYQYPGNKQFRLRFSGNVVKGDLVIIRGNNGAGKSTLLKLIAGILTPDQGSIQHGNTKIGFVMQTKPRDDELFAFPRMAESHALKRSLMQNLFDVLDLTELPKPMDGLGLHGRAFTHEIELSRGQWQRLSLYRAISNTEGLLLLDEPETALEPDIREKFVDFLEKHRQSFYTLITTHHDYFDHLATQIWHLEKGTMHIYRNRDSGEFARPIAQG